MTTLSKEDVVRAAFEKYFDPDDNGTHWHTFRDAYEIGEQAARADLVTENELLKAEFNSYKRATDLAYKGSEQETQDKLTATRTALAAAEAREEKLREALSIARFGQYLKSEVAAIDAVLSQPRDDSALREMIAGVYEECAKVCDASADRQDAEFDAYLKSGGKGPATNLSAIARGYADAIRALAEKHKDNK